MVFKSTVILGRVTAGTWNRLAPQARPAPEDNTHPGRVHVVQGGGGSAHPTQVLLLTDAEAAEWGVTTAPAQN
ncbi:hypothetical protein [Streptomyces sp. SudanB25_2051]|uniref:hypothetical protein n=1 Tax=Streptomyces sp. SudanB25_2051 TaxID=3035275 RepID=UPI003F55D5E6